MTKIVFVSEGFITKNDLEIRKIPEMFEEFKDQGYEFKFVEDLGAVNTVGGNMRESNLKLEKEGPNWVKHDPKFLESIADADIIIMHYSGASKAFFDAAKNLKLLCVMRSGVENVDLEAAKEHGVTVTFSPGRAAEPVADMAVVLMLVLMRQLFKNNMSGTGKWKEGLPMGSEGMMKNSIVSLLGFGAIAQKVALRLKGFGCRIISYDPWANKKIADDMGVELVETIEELFERADFLSIHARLTPDNHGLVGKDLLSRMKPTAYIVNTARAGLIDEDALIDALQNKIIGGAGLDVFQNEPLSDGHPFLTLDNVVCTPHVAGNGGDWIIRSIDSPFNEVRHYFNGEDYSFKASK